MNNLRVWNGCVLEISTAYGIAARFNRGGHSGRKIHQLEVETLIGLVEGTEVRPGTYADTFIKTGKPV